MLNSVAAHKLMLRYKQIRDMLYRSWIWSEFHGQHWTVRVY